jgi:hypothetical protein
MDRNTLVQAHRKLCSSSVLNFTCKMFEYTHKTPYIVGEHHRMICEALDDVIRGRCKKLMINIAPRYGKTLLVSQMFQAYGLAINPESKFLHLSYSAGLVSDNSLGVKDVLQSEYFQALFPARIAYGNNTRSRWSTVQGGGLYATSTLGQITGFGAGRTEREEENEMETYCAIGGTKFAGAIVIDDPIRPEDALSETIRESVNRRFETTIRNRVNSRNTPMVIIMQRLHIHDLCGYLLEVEPSEWRLLNLPCIYEEEGEEKALWEHKHTIEELHKLREINPWVFETQYMQNPKPLEGLLFPEEETKYFKEIPDNPDFVFIQVDPADEGKDMYCSKVFYVKDREVYNVDVLYSSDSVEVMLPRQMEQIRRWKPSVVNIESNSAWRLVARDIRDKVVEAGWDIEVRRFSAHANKETRIFNEAPTIRNRFYYLDVGKQGKEYKAMMHEKHNYLKMGKGQRDDGVDCDAAASHYLKRNEIIDVF